MKEEEKKNEILGSTGKRLFYGKSFAGTIHKNNADALEEFKNLVFDKGLNMNYNGEKEKCGWLILFQRNNKIEKALKPIANKYHMDVDVFIDGLLDKILDSIVLYHQQNDIVGESEEFHGNLVDNITDDATIDVTKHLRSIVAKRQN